MDDQGGLINWGRSMRNGEWHCVRLACVGMLLGVGVVSATAVASGVQDPAALAEKWFPPPTVPLLNPGAEAAEWSRVETVYARMAELARGHEQLEWRVIGTTELGMPIHALFFSSGRADALTVQIQARVHGNEPASTEGAMELAIRLAQGDLEEVSVNLIIIPVLNPEGAVQMERATGTDIDPNRDYVLQKSASVRAVYRLLQEFDPYVVLDMHEFRPWGRLGGPGEDTAHTIGSDLLSIGPNHPNLPLALRAFTAEVMVEGIGQRLGAAGLRFGRYELLDRLKGVLRVRESAPSFVSAKNALALGGRISLLTEGRGIGLGNQHYHRRTFAQYLAARAVIETAIRHEEEIKQLVQEVRAEVSTGERQWVLATEHREVSSTYELIHVGTNEMETVASTRWDHSEGLPTVVLEVPEAYFIPAKETVLLENLRGFGIDLAPVEPVDSMAMEVLRVAAFTPSSTVLYGGTKQRPDGSIVRGAVRRDHRIEITAERELRSFPEGGFIATTRGANALFLIPPRT